MHRSSLFVVVLALAPVSLAAPLRHPAAAVSFAGAAAESPASRAPADLEAKVDAIAREYLAKPGGVGLSIAVAEKGKVLLAKGYGIADAEFDVLAGSATLFRIGSVTKQFTAALILRFVEQGKLTLDDPLSKFVPSFPLQGRTVTIRQLLNHTSGIKSYTDIGEPWHKVWPLELSHDELLALVKDAPFDFEPGTDFRYSNTGYYLLGMVIEKVAGKSYGEALQTEICVPLGLTRTRYDSNSELIKDRAQGYTLEKGELVNDQPIGMSQPGAAGAILSTGEDLVRWQMALTSGRVVKPESFAQMTKSTVLPNGRDTKYGFGLASDEFVGHARVAHGGGIFGFNSMLLWIRDADVHVAVVSNGEPVSSSKIAEAITYAALGIEKAAPKDEPISPERIRELAGEYEIAELGLGARVFDERGQLMVQATGQGAFRILWQGGDEFRASFDDSVKIVFAADRQSFELYQGGGKFTAKRAQ